MRVAMVSEHASPLAVLGGEDAGGQNVHVAELARALARQGAEVVVHTRRDATALDDRVEFAPGVIVHHVDAGPAQPIPKDDLYQYMPAFARVLHREWRVHRPDVVHAHFWMSGKACLLAARPLDLSLLQTFHALGTVKRRYQGASDPSPRERIATERGVIAAADRVIATCRDEVSELTALGADPRRISVIPCGVDLTRFTPEGHRLGRRPGMLRAVAVSRLVPRKGLADAIEAVASVPGVELLVAGGPDGTLLQTDPEARRLSALARRLGVDDRVRLLGRVDNADVPALLRSADVALCTPWYEPFGMVAVEAMACGLPVIASAVGGMLDTVEDQVTGLHVPPRKPAAIAAAPRRVLGEPALRARMSAAAVRRAAEGYGWDRIAGSTLEAYVEARTSARLAADTPRVVAR